MTIEGDDYVPDREDEIHDDLIADFEAIYSDENAGVEIGQLLEAIFGANAQAGAVVEQKLDQVYDSAFLETATGESLDLVVDTIGIQRRDATHATGSVVFERDNPTSNNYTIQNGTTVQTGGSEPIKFETVGSTTLPYIDGFESGSLTSEWGGDTGGVTVVDGSNDPSPSDGTYHVKVNSTDNVSIVNNEYEFNRGVTFHTDVHLTVDSIATIQWHRSDPSNYYQVTIDANSDALTLEVIEDGSSTTIDSSNKTIPEDTYLSLEIDDGVDGSITCTLTNGDTEVAITSGEDKTHTSGAFAIGSGGSNGVKYFDEITTSAVGVNIRASEGGTLGNVNTNTIRVMPSPPTGISSVHNPIPTGDSSYTDVDGRVLTVGTERESDDELRERAQETVTKGGSATVDALLSSLVHEYGEGDPRGVEGVQSASVYTNKTNTDNTGSGGLPPKSFEVVAYGGDEQSIAEAIFDTTAITDRSYGGAHGNGTTVSVNATNGQSWDVQFSRPTRLDVDITLSLVIDETYDGNEAVQDRIVEYIGGTDNDGNDVIGTDVGEDVIWSEVYERVMEDDGVIGIDSYSTTPALTTDSNNLEVIDVGETEVALTDATDSSISITTTQR